MPDMPKELAQRVAQTANRLRQIQADFADDQAKTREQYLSDEIKETLSQILPEQRDAFLDALKEHFPTWDASMVVPDAPSQADAGQSKRDQEEWNDVSFVLERLIALAKDQPEDQKQQLIIQLSQAGLTAAGELGCPQRLVDELKAKLKLTQDDTIQPARVVELATQLVIFAQSLDHLTWQIWKQIDTRSKRGNNGNLQSTMTRFSRGDSDVSLSRDVEHLRHLVAALLSAIGQVGRQFAQQHLARFAPADIKAAVARDKSIWTSEEVLCWKHYEKLFQAIDDPAAIDIQIKQIIADFVKSLPGLAR